MFGQPALIEFLPKQKEETFDNNGAVKCFRVIHAVSISQSCELKKHCVNPRVDLSQISRRGGGVDGSIALVQIAAANDSDMIFDASLGMA